MEKKQKTENGNGKLAVIERANSISPATGGALRVVEVALEKLEAMRALATTLLRSGFLPEAINSVEKAVTIMLKGLELGVPTMTALANISVIKGKPVVQGNIMLALIAQAGGKWEIKEQTEKSCIIKFSRPGFGDYIAKFTIADAERAGLLAKKGDIWTQYPQLMLFWRAVAIGARTLFPDIITGMYLPEELGDHVVLDNDGNVQVVEDIEVVEPKKTIILKPKKAKEQIVEETVQEIISDPVYQPTNKPGKKDDTVKSETVKDEPPLEDKIIKTLENNDQVNKVVERVKEVFDTEQAADETRKKKFVQTMQALEKRLRAAANNDLEVGEALYELYSSYKCNGLNDFQIPSDMERCYFKLKQMVEVKEAGLKLPLKKK
ncbi:MAG: hypothetical protein AMQ22_00222 [Candidatus Methanofastidiosum methylothiophilum]|uniref:RecT family protein n=1 Tax=Candidatus Methanofastidiosum methylothiophilum TaxID=1705564 RepID=A0A150J8M3_9EURY|nr:MAG: hypothetical protein APG11_00821 [Candidatus Methanofastidiosum methylthiophilus]KYC53551.1 MAG: hypothetical protein AMQ22_00222 [Candidatus Methanofastidiosum methylthiophilus]